MGLTNVCQSLQRALKEQETSWSGVVSLTASYLAYLGPLNCGLYTLTEHFIKKNYTYNQ